MNTHENDAFVGTEKFIYALRKLKNGDLGILRAHANRPLDESLQGFDLFTSIWWGLRKNNQWAPEREVSWIIAKLFAQYPIEAKTNQTLARKLRACVPQNEILRYRVKFDALLLSPLVEIEPYLGWALRTIIQQSNLPENTTLDWVQLTNDLSNWNLEKTRRTWSQQFLNPNNGE